MENPVIRLFFIFGGAFLLTSFYIMITGWFPAPYQWFPFGTNPSIGSIPYIFIFTVSAFASGALWWVAFYAHGKRVKQQTLERYGLIGHK